MMTLLPHMASALSLVMAATAQTASPSQPIKVIAPFPPGGPPPMDGTPQEAAALLKAEQQRWDTVVRASDVKLD